MTSAEAVRDMREIITAARTSPTVTAATMAAMFDTVREIARDGYDPVIGVRMRRFRRLAGL